MISMKKILSEIGNSFNFKLSALEKIRRITLSSSSKIDFNATEKKWLQQTVLDTTYELYRGLGLIYQRLTSEEIEFVKTLKEGDKLPKFLLKNIHNNKILSYTKKFNVAKGYSEGKVSIVYKVNVDRNNVVVDLENLNVLLQKENIDQNIIDSEDFKYFRRDKEVLVDVSLEKDATIVYLRK